jgi:alkanesulfonate monooxygenase SsuD/methylene tetrahydromethanopterin reductase-like flavin-dependent oxidoreductase (luciferase family)
MTDAAPGPDVRVGMTLPSFVEDPSLPIEVARAAEAAGLDGVFLFDHLWRGDPPQRRPALECFTLLGAVAAATSRITLGTLVARATLRPAATLVNSLRTAQRVSGGRVIAGIGSGDSESRPENEAFGLDFGTMADRIDALHDAVRAVRDVDIPVWVGGKAAPVRELVALADGWNRWGAAPGRFGAEAALVRDIAPRAALTWGGLVLLGEDDADAAERAESRARMPSGNVIVGGPESAAAAFARYVALGAEWIIAGPVDASDPRNPELIVAAGAELRAAR